MCEYIIYYMYYILYIVTTFWKYVVTQRPKMHTVSWLIITAVFPAALTNPSYSLTYVILRLVIQVNRNQLFSWKAFHSDYVGI